MELVVDAKGVIEIDGKAVGTWNVGESGYQGALTIAAERLQFQINGPFSQGYSVRVTGPGRPGLELVYSWRDGYEFRGDSRESSLRLEETLLASGDAIVARISWTSQFVRLRFTDDVPLSDAARYGALVAVNRFFGEKIGPFSK